MKPTAASAPVSAQIRQAYIWTAAGTAVRQLVTFGISMLLARLLAPADYGLIGMVLVVTAVVSAMQDAGLSQAVVYFRDHDEQLPTFATITTALGLLSTLLLAAAAPLVAGFYSEPQLTLLLRALAPNMALLGLRAVPQGLLTRQLRFRELMFVETISSTLAGAAAVYMAWQGYGVWSLVANILLGSALGAVGLCILAPPRFTVRPDWAGVRKLFGWSLPLTGSQLLWQIYDNADYLVVGRLLGPVALGYYTFAFRLATLIHQRIGSVVNRVSFPSFAAVQSDRRELVRQWFAVNRRVAVLTFPLLGGLGVAGGDFIAAVVGEKWMPALVPLRFLCVIGAIRCVLPVAFNVSAALGRTDLNLRAMLLNALVLPPAFVAGAKWGGGAGVAAAFCIVNTVLSGVMLRQITRVVGTTLTAYAKNLSSAILLTLITTTVMLPVEWVEARAIERLLLRGVLGLIATGVCLALWSELRQLIWPFQKRS